MLDMRFGKDTDIPFIINLVRDEVASGAFFFNEKNSYNILENQLKIVTSKYRDNVCGADFLFVFEDKAKQETIGFVFLTGRNDKSGHASHLEIRMFAVTPKERKKGRGKEILASIIQATPGHRLEASCLPSSMNMMKLLAGQGFTLINETLGGKRTFSFDNFRR